MRWVGHYLFFFGRNVWEVNPPRGGASHFTNKSNGGYNAFNGKGRFMGDNTFECWDGLGKDYWSYLDGIDLWGVVL